MIVVRRKKGKLFVAFKKYGNGKGRLLIIDISKFRNLILLHEYHVFFMNI